MTAGTLHRQYGQFFLKLLEFIINTWLPTEELKSEVDEFKARQTQLGKRIRTVRSSDATWSIDWPALSEFLPSPVR